MPRTLKQVCILAAPALLAALAVFFVESRLGVWLRGREAFLPLLICLLFSSLLHPRLRQMLIVALCYGVAFLALKDVSSPAPLRLPPQYDYVWSDGARAIALLLVALLAGGAALVESRRPGTVGARRCYFLAASLYFFGSGLLYYLRNPSWQSIMLCATGVIALLGSVFADRIVASEQEELAPPDPDADATEQERREHDHRRALRAKEWHDRPETDPEAGGQGPAASATP